MLDLGFSFVGSNGLIAPARNSRKNRWHGPQANYFNECVQIQRKGVTEDGGKLILTKQSIRLSPVMATTAQGSTGEAGGLLVGDHTAP